MIRLTSIISEINVEFILTLYNAIQRFNCKYFRDNVCIKNDFQCIFIEITHCRKYEHCMEFLQSLNISINGVKL